MSQNFNIGSTVKIVVLPAYFKTADPMPMLRPASILEIGAIGLITNRQPGNYWVVKFDRGSFLLEERYLQVTSD